jgi:hypothetical protein
MKRRVDWVSLAGGSALFAFAYFDQHWRYFWMTGGVLVIAWAVGSAITGSNDKT